MAPIPESEVLSKVALFRGLLSENLCRLAILLEEKSFPAETRVITAEEPGEAVYIVLRGSVKVCVDQPGGTEVVIATWALARWSVR